ncbi:MAG: hypothetical protein ABIP55_11050, partial [Tepidisphaeraceae bacterium]
PECGKPIVASLGQTRTPPEWEALNAGSGLSRFLQTTSSIIFRPTAFFKSITTRGDVDRAARFGRVHWLFASLLFGIAGSMHASVFYMSGLWTARTFSHVAGAFLLTVITYNGLWGTTWVAVRLTAWEAAYRGYRLPLKVVTRGMYYHAAHYLPVALGTFFIIGVYRLALRMEWISATTLTAYLYVLCAAVIAAAAYLFHTYWIGMRNMMYANR